MGSSQRWVKLGYQDAIDMGRDRYAHMVYNTLKSRTGHTVQEKQLDSGRKIITMPGWIRISQAALARELGIGRNTLLHTLRFLEMRKILSYQPDDQGTTIRFNNFAYHASDNDAVVKQGCSQPEHNNRSSLDQSINTKTLVVEKRPSGEAFNRRKGSFVPDERATMQYLAMQRSVQVASSLSETVRSEIRRITQAQGNHDEGSNHRRVKVCRGASWSGCNSQVPGVP